MRCSFLLLLLPGVAQLGAALAITAPETVRSGEPLQFSWSGGTKPYILKILIDSQVVSENRGWGSESNSWVTSDVDPGTIVKVRVIDADGDMVLSTGTEVVDENSREQPKTVTITETARGSRHTYAPDDSDRTVTNDGYPGGDWNADGSDWEDHFPTSTIDAFSSEPTGSGDFDMGSGNDSSNSTSSGSGDSEMGDSTNSTSVSANITTSAGLSATATSAVASASSGAVATGAATGGATMDLDTTAGMSGSASAASATSSSASSESSTDSESETSTSTYVIIAVVVILLLACAGGGVWYYLHTQKKNKAHHDKHEKGAHSDAEHSDEEALVGDGKNGHPDSETDPSEDEGRAPASGKRGAARKAPQSETDSEPSGDERAPSSRRR